MLFRIKFINQFSKFRLNSSEIIYPKCFTDKDWKKSENQQYVETLEELFRINKFRYDAKLILDKIQKVSNLVGNPDKTFKSIHVAGTNGSVCLKIANVLQESGYKVGLYTSPHLFTFRERIQINSQYIDQNSIINILQNLYHLTNQNNIHLTFFEYLTMMAFQYFQKQNVDFVVVETGLGGILDATNIITPLASVITSIGLDHCEFLGNTTALIAGQKAGIIKPNVPSIIGPNSEPYEVFQQKAAEVNSKLTIVSEGSNQLFPDFNQENIMISDVVIKVLQQTYPQYFTKIPTDYQKFLNATQKCRNESVDIEKIQKISMKKEMPHEIILDVGHNGAALQKLMSTLNLTSPDSKKVLIFGTSRQKNAFQTLKQLLLNEQQQIEKIYFIEANHGRAMPITQLAEIQNLLKQDVEIQHKYQNASFFSDIINNGNIKSTINEALNKTHKNQSIIICGSFFIMQEVRDYFQYQDEKDPFELNEMKTY